MTFIKNKIITMSDLEKRFSFDPSDQRNLISDKGLWSQVWKVFDKNGQTYAGKFPPHMYFGYDLSLNEPEFLDIVASSRFHENYIAQKISEINPEYTPKPEGIFAIECKNTNFYFPAFVNEYNENTKIKYIIHPSDIPFMQELFEKGFFLRGDSFTLPNNLITKKGRIQVIDFGWWGYQNVINPFPRLEKQHLKELLKYSETHKDYSQKVLKKLKESSQFSSHPQAV